MYILSLFLYVNVNGFVCVFACKFKNYEMKIYTIKKKTFILKMKSFHLKIWSITTKI